MNDQVTQSQQPQGIIQPNQQQVSGGQKVPVGTSRKSFKKIVIVVVLLGLSVGGAILGYSLLQENKREGGTVNPPFSPSSEKKTIISDSFDSFTLDTEKWQDWVLNDGAQINQKNSTIEISVLPGRTSYTDAGLNSTINITGDFEASVDIVLVEGGEIFGSESALVFHDDSWENQISIYVRKELEDQVVIHAVTIENGFEVEVGKKVYDYPGPFKVRIVRDRQNVTFSVREGESFVPLGQTGNFYRGDGAVSFHVNSKQPDFPSVLSAFDNFVLALQ